MAEWVVLELTTQGEDEDPDVLRASLTRSLKGCEIFIPASISKVGDSRVVHKLIDNYVFVKRDQPDHFYFKMEGSKYVLTVLTTPEGRSRRISSVRDSDIAKMKKQIVVETEQGIEVDDEVEVMSGAYKGIRGRVIEEIQENDSVQVYISLRSKQTIVTLPRSFLRFVPAEDQTDVPAFAPFLTKVARIQELVRRAQAPLTAMAFDLTDLLSRTVEVAKSHFWVDKLAPLLDEVVGRRHVDELLEIPETSKLKVKLTEVERLGRLAQGTLDAASVSEDLSPPTGLANQLAKVELLHRARAKSQALGNQLVKIEATIAKAEENARSKRHH